MEPVVKNVMFADTSPRTIYIIRGQETFTRLLDVVFRELLGYSHENLTMDELPARTAAAKPDVIVVLEDADLYKELAGFGQYQNIPVLFVAVADTDLHQLPPLRSMDGYWVMRNDPAGLLEVLDGLTPRPAVKRILSVDDSPTVLKQIRKAFYGTPYMVFTAENGQVGLEALDAVQPDLILTDVEMPIMDGLELCRQVRMRSDTADTPLIILSSRVDYDTIARGFDSGADEYLTKPFSPDELLNKVESYLVPPPARRKEHILVVTGSNTVTHLLKTALEKQGFEVTTVVSAGEAFEAAYRETPELVISDSELPDMTGFQFCTQVRSTPEMTRTPFVIMTGKTSTGARKMGEKVGISAYLIKPFTPENVLVMVERLMAENRSLRALEWDMVLASITSLARALDERDPYTRFHSENVARYAVAIGRKDGLNAVELENIRLAGLLHDIGKIGIPDIVLHKPGRLSEAEFEKIKEHSRLGAEILQPIPSLEDVVPGILHHHERQDGGGYPMGLKGDEIPPIAQILAVADTFDALVTDRPYRKGMPREKALDIMKEASGPQLAPKYVSLFLRWLEESDNGTP